MTLDGNNKEPAPHIDVCMCVCVCVCVYIYKVMTLDDDDEEPATHIAPTEGDSCQKRPRNRPMKCQRRPTDTAYCSH